MTTRDAVPVFVMDVTIQSLLENEAQGRVKISCDPSDTIDSLISAFCIEKGVRQKKDYVIRNINNDILHNTRKIETCGINDGDTLYLTSNTSTESTFGFNNWWLLAGVSLLIGTIGIIAISVLKVTGDATPQEYGIVIDCGSTHTEVFLYQWPGGKLKGTGVIKQVSSCRIKGYLASFETHPQDAGPSLVDCINKATVKVPKNLREETPIYLGATAGMRMLSEKNATVSDTIMDSVRATLKTFPFKFDDPTSQARIITGREEGSFSWVTTNYLSDVFEVTDSRKIRRPSTTYGALDLGGASTQITFQAAPGTLGQIPPEYIEPLLLYGDSFNTYTDSFLCYGKTEVENRLLAVLANVSDVTTISNPCGPRGKVITKSYAEVFEPPCTTGKHAIQAFGTEVRPRVDIPKNATFQFQGMSNSAQCQVEVEKLFDFKTCKYPGQCSFNNHFIPKLHGQFLAFTGYFHVMDFLNLTENHEPGDVPLSRVNNAVNNLCAKDWSEVKDIKTEVPALLPYYCFDGHYILTLLTAGYGFTKDNWDAIRFVDNLNGTTVGWPIGYMLNVSNSIPEVYPVEKISLPVFIGLLVVFILFIVVAIGFACHAKNAVQPKSEYQKLPEYGTV